jgi:hypothetical protein
VLCALLGLTHTVTLPEVSQRAPVWTLLQTSFVDGRCVPMALDEALLRVVSHAD